MSVFRVRTLHAGRPKWTSQESGFSPETGDRTVGEGEILGRFSRMREPWLSGAAVEMLGRAPVGARQWAISKILEPPGALRNFLACTPIQYLFNNHTKNSWSGKTVYVTYRASCTNQAKAKAPLSSLGVPAAPPAATPYTSAARSASSRLPPI